MTNPKTPVEANFPVPPPLPHFQIADQNGMPTTLFISWCQLMWAAIQGQGGLFDLELLALFGQQFLDGDVSQLQVKLKEIESILLTARDLQPEVDNTRRRINDLEALIFTFQGGSSDAVAVTDTDNTSWVPLVDGSEPPNFITDGAGNLIFVSFTP